MLKFNFRFAAIALVGISVGSAGLVGCQSKLERDKSSALNAAEFFQQDLAKMPAQIDLVTKDLTAATAGAVTNRPALFAQYSKDLKVLNQQAQSLASARDNAVAHTQDYFREWLKSTRKFKTEAERNAAIAKYDAGAQNFDTSKEYLRLGASNFRALVDEFNNAETLLKADLSEANVDKVRASLGPVYGHALEVKGYVERLEDQINAALVANKK